jgi:kynurenine formamidase
MIAGAEVIELGQPFGPGLGMHQTDEHPPFGYELFNLHSRIPLEPSQAPGSSAGTDSITTGLHVGTHIDSLAHVAADGLLCDGTDVFAPGVQGASTGVKMESGSTLRPIAAPGVLLDFPGYLGREVLEDDHVITVEELLGCAENAEVEIAAGQVVLIRTGFDLLWDQDPERYLSPPFPGPGIQVARLLREAGVVATGSDTITYEAYPSDAVMDVHIELLVKGGIFIMEVLQLRELAARRTFAFDFVALPLNMPQATGSPINPVALIQEDSRGA